MGQMVNADYVRGVVESRPAELKLSAHRGDQIVQPHIVAEVKPARRRPGDSLDVEGIAWSPTRGLHLSDDLRLNYIVSAMRA